MTATFVGLDLSLTGAGVGVAGVARNTWVGYTETHGYALKKPTLFDQLKRIDFVRDSVLDSIDSLGYLPDLLCIEEMPYSASGTAVHQLAALWMDVVRGIRDREIPFVKVNVSKLKIYATGRGNKLEKKDVMNAIIGRYPEVEITNDNEADAFGLTAIAARLGGHPLELELPDTHTRALEGLEFTA